jgi:hypothetical protein
MALHNVEVSVNLMFYNFSDTMADAFDDFNCNIEVERIINMTKGEKGIVSETPIQKT